MTDEGPADSMMQHIADGAEHIYLALGATDFRKQQSGLVSFRSWMIVMCE